MKKKHILSTALIAAMIQGGCLTAMAENNGGLDYSNMDLTVNPGDDFSQYATGNWLKNNPQPAAYPRWGNFNKLADNCTNQVADLIRGLEKLQNTPGSTAQKICSLYSLLMDSTRLDREGIAPLKPYLKQVKAINSREEMMKYMCGRHRNMVFTLGLGSDDRDAKNNALWLVQGGLSLKNKDYYLSDKPELVKIREAFRLHVKNLFRLAGDKEKEAQRKADLILSYQTQLAQHSKSLEEMRDPDANYNKMSIAKLSAETAFDWDKYLKAYGYDNSTDIIVGQPEAAKEACRILSNAPLEDLKVMMEYSWIDYASPFLGNDFTLENFHFNQTLTGQKEMQPLWKRSVNTVNSVLGECVGQLYVERYFPAEAKQRMTELVRNLQTSLGERIMAQEWMSDSTKSVAMEKLQTFYVKIGYPDKWGDYSQLSIDGGKSLLENMIATDAFKWEKDKREHYNTKVDKDEWFMTPQTVNAYYNPTTNEICFPAGILQPPFFSLGADDAVNYGAIGVVIGHEMTHGFDDQGSKYDKDGNLRQWWKDSDVEAFGIPSKAMAEYFDSLWVIPGDLRSNGKLCLGENLADHGGLNIAYHAMQLAKQNGSCSYVEQDHGFSAAQRFFISYATVWAGTCSEEMLRRLTMIDVHSASFLRTNGGVAQCDYWYDAFGIKPGDKLYVAPEKRVKIW